MKVRVAKKQLADSLSHIERIIPHRSSNPGLSLVRLELSSDRLGFSGSNMDIDIEATLPADVEGAGQFALPAQVFAQVVRALPGDSVELASGERELEVSSGSYATKLQLADTANAPVLDFPEAYAGAASAQDLTASLSHVRYAAAVAEYQAIFRGVKLEFSDARTRAIATDGFRLAYYDVKGATGLEGDIVVPARSVDELVRILGDGQEVGLELAGHQLSIKSGPYRLNLKLMEGSFPDYQRVIPQNFPVNITLDAKALAEAVARVAVMADKTANNRVDLFIKDGNLEITAEGGFGRAQESLEVHQEGSDAEIALAYNAKYLVDAINPVEGDVQLRFSGATSPSVLVSLEDASYLAMVVPLRVG
ncbi:MAG TPA: DNA polymerase III subunit beta [Trueperaceae bacterium]